MITAIIPTLNEQDFIEDAIASVSFADEIIVIDSYSSDKTIDLAKKHSVRILQREFDNFSSQKNFAINQSKNDWIFVLDADERVSMDLKNEITQAVIDPGDQVGFFIYRIFYFMDERIRFGGWQTDKVMRLFNKNYCSYDGKLVHEKIAYKGKAGFLSHKLDHFSYQDFEQYWGKLEFYAQLQAKELIQDQKKIHFGYKLFKPGFRFFVHYIIRLGFLDGQKGYTLAKLHAHAVNQRYLQMDLINNRQENLTE